MSARSRRPSAAAAPSSIALLPTANSYLQRILNARVYEVAKETQLTAAHKLSKRLHNKVLLKREDEQAVFSFKLRGAYNKMAHLTEAQRAKGVICASAGNHAQGVALSAKRLGCRAVIVMPVTTPQVKVQAVAALGGEVVLHGESYNDAFGHAQQLERAQGLTFVHPFDDPDVIAGQGTIAMELLRQHPGPIDAVFVAIGGGGLISGVSAYIKALRPEIKVIGVQTVDSDAMLRSVKAGKRVQLSDVGLFADGTAVKLVGEETFRVVKELVDDFIVVNTDEVCAAIKDVFEDTRSILEPSGAMSVAALKKYVAATGAKGKSLVAITCGANMNFDRLRFVAERADVGEQREALFAVTVPEARGSFKRFCELIGNRSVTEFNYRIADASQAHIFVGLSIQKREEAAKLARTFKRAGFEAIDLTDDELAKQHLRHMVGGRSPLAQDERLLRFDFPERPGALMRFLSAMHPDWNISLFHYRNQGSDYGRILVGLQVPKRDSAALSKFLATLNYPFEDETANPVYRMFLR
ncbi:threonine ammonia-lyase, biosynthetic [Roseateles paludis]|jgi:threonine dehydratase|uniref:L-threonine dehydratase n=1 Tax=Roseateles paludis TaxID=3145238 RepID=A0ABV0G4K4_9BURK